MKALRIQLLAALVCLGLGGCASVGPPLPPSLELPKPPTDLHAARKGNNVTLTWTVPTRTTDRRIVRYLGNTEVCRGLEPVLKVCSKPAGKVPPPANFEATKKALARKLTLSFVDGLPAAMEQEHPTEFMTYAIEVLNKAGRGAGLSNQVHVPLLPALAPFPDFSAKVIAQGVLLTWRCPENTAAQPAGATYLFRIYRRPISDTVPQRDETRIAELDATACATGEPAAATGQATRPDSPANEHSFLDKTFEWQHTYLYWGAVVSVMRVPDKPAIEVEGDDTPEAKVFANDVFPPAVPTGLQAASSGPGQQPFVDLIWTPDTDADLAGYNVYRRQGGEPVKKMNSELVKVPAFRDAKVIPGRTYFYSVSAVDTHGNESPRSEEASETVP